MPIKALVTIHTKDGVFSPGDVLTLPQEEANSLIARGYAEPAPEVAPKSKPKK
jgi:hypothetical protein